MCIIRQPVNFFTKNDTPVNFFTKNDNSVKNSVKIPVKFSVSLQCKKYTCKFILPLLHNFYVYVDVELYIYTLSHIYVVEENRYVKKFYNSFGTWHRCRLYQSKSIEWMSEANELGQNLTDIIRTYIIIYEFYSGRLLYKRCRKKP